MRLGKYGIYCYLFLCLGITTEAYPHMLHALFVKRLKPDNPISGTVLLM